MVSGSLTESSETDKERAAIAMNSTENSKAHKQRTVGFVGHTVQKSQLESGHRLTGREDYGKTTQRERHTLVWTKIFHVISKHLQLTCLQLISVDAILFGFASVACALETKHP